MAEKNDGKKQKPCIVEIEKARLSTNTSKPNPFLVGSRNQDKPSPEPKPDNKPKKPAK